MEVVPLLNEREKLNLVIISIQSACHLPSLLTVACILICYSVQVIFYVKTFISLNG